MSYSSTYTHTMREIYDVTISSFPLEPVATEPAARPMGRRLHLGPPAARPLRRRLQLGPPAARPKEKRPPARRRHPPRLHLGPPAARPVRRRLPLGPPAARPKNQRLPARRRQPPSPRSRWGCGPWPATHKRPTPRAPNTNVKFNRFLPIQIEQNLACFL